MVKKLNPKQHREIQLAALEVIDAVNTMRASQHSEGSWFGPFDAIVLRGNFTFQEACINWSELEEKVQRLQRAIDELPRVKRKSDWEANL